MEGLTILTVTRSEYVGTEHVASCSHCQNCGGHTGCGPHCRGGKQEK